MKFIVRLLRKFTFSTDLDYTLKPEIFHLELTYSGSVIWSQLVLGRTQFVGSEFGIFGGFGWVCSSVLVGKPGFGRVRSSDLEFGELWRTLDILFWTQYHLIFG